MPRDAFKLAGASGKGARPQLITTRLALRQHGKPAGLTDNELLCMACPQSTTGLPGDPRAHQAIGQVLAVEAQEGDHGEAAWAAT